MILSKCCRQDVRVNCANDYGMFYVCSLCEIECDIIFLMESQNKDEPMHAEV